MEIKPLTGNLLESPIPEQQVQQEAAPAQAQPAQTQPAAKPVSTDPPEDSLEMQKRKTRGALRLLDMAMKAHRRKSTQK